MANGNGADLLNKNIDQGTWKGYVVKTLEDLTGYVKQLQEHSVEKEDFNELVHSVKNLVKSVDDLSKCISGCEIEKVKTALYGDLEAQKDGVIGRLSKLEVSHKIKSSYYGVLGGGGMAAMLILVYHLIGRKGQ